MSGKIGIYFTSTSVLARNTRNIGGRFELVTAQWPSVKADGHLPAGGNGVVMVAKDPKQQEAAWKVIKFFCGPRGSELMARNTGYMPANFKAVENLDAFYQATPNNLTAVNAMAYPPSASTKGKTQPPRFARHFRFQI